MGWGWLGKALGAVGAVGAAPFTGGGSLAALPAILGAAAPIIGGIAGGRAQGRQAEAGQIQSQDELRARLAQLEAERAKFQMEAPGFRAGQTARGDILSNLQDIQFQPVRGRSQSALEGKMTTGGLGASTFGPNTRAAGAKLSELGLANLGKDTFNIPTPSKMPQANWLDKVLNVAGPAASLAGAFANRDTGGEAPQGGFDINPFIQSLPQAPPEAPPQLPLIPPPRHFLGGGRY